MTDSEKLDKLVDDVTFIRSFIEGLRMGGPRILPGDGSKPPAPPPPPAPPADTPASHLSPFQIALLGGTTVHPPTADTPPPSHPSAPQIDRRSLRDLSDSQGPAIVEGPAGTTAFIQCRQPVGKMVDVTFGTCPSEFGHCTSADVFVGDKQSEGGRGSDAIGHISFSASGNDVLRVVLNDAGAVEVHRSY